MPGVLPLPARAKGFHLSFRHLSTQGEKLAPILEGDPFQRLALSFTVTCVNVGVLMVTQLWSFCFQTLMTHLCLSDFWYDCLYSWHDWPWTKDPASPMRNGLHF